MIFDPLYFIILAPALLFAMWAQWRVQSAFARARQVPVRYSGAEAARMMLDRNGLHQVGIEPIEGMLSDHYDPRSKVLRLSPGVFGERSAAAVGIAAHEAGHALQDAQGYAPLVIRNAAVPLAATGGNLSMIIFIVGLFLSAASGLKTIGMMLVLGGIALYAFVVFFQLVNLPVEFDASARAKRALHEMGMVDAYSAAEVSRVLNAAAMTYVAATVSAVLTLLYLLIRSGLLGGRDD